MRSVSRLDANALLNDIAQGQQGNNQKQSQGQGSGSESAGINIATGDLADQRAGGSPSIDQRLNELNKQGQCASKNESTSQVQAQDQISAQGQSGFQGQNAGLDQGSTQRQSGGVDISVLISESTPNKGQGGSNDTAVDIARQLAGGEGGSLSGQDQAQAQGQDNAQGDGGKGQLIQVFSTTITKPNGQAIATALVQAAGQHIQGTSPPATTSPAAAPQAAAAPMAEKSSVARNSTSTAEALIPIAAAKSSSHPAKGLNTTVCIPLDVPSVADICSS